MTADPTTTDHTAATLAEAHTPARRARRFTAMVTYVFRACLPARRLAVLGLPCLAIVGSGLLSLAVDARPAKAFAQVAAVAIFGLAMPLGTLIVGDAVLGAEVRSGTLALTWSTPVRRWELALARWTGGWIIALITLVPSAALAAVLAGVGSHIGPIVVATAAESAAHIALFVLIGCWTRRAAVWSLGVVFLVERLLGAVLSGIAQLSPTWQGRAAYSGLADAEFLHRSGIPEGWGAVVRLGIITAVCLAGAAYGLRRLRLSGPRD